MPPRPIPLRVGVLALALLASLLGAWTGRRMLDTANTPVAEVLAALHAHADPPTPAPPPPSRRVVVAVIDGLGARTFDALLDRGALGPEVAWRARVDVGTPSLSRPVYHTLLTGVPARVAGPGNNSDHGPARADTLADRVRAAGGTVAWSLTGVPWFHDLAGAPGDAYALGPAAVPGFLPAWRRGATLAVLHLIAVDVAGHHAGGASPGYARAAQDAARTVRQLREATRSAPGFEHAVWFVGADHGHADRGGHGGPEPAVRFVTWVALVPGHTGPPSVVPGIVPVERLAPTFALALGVAPPREALGAALAVPGFPTQPEPPSLAPRREAVRAAMESSRAAARTAGGVRVLLVVLLLGAALARFRSDARALGGAALVVGAACGLWLLATLPAVSLTAIVTQDRYLFRSLLALALGAFTALPLVRRAGTTPPDVVLASALPPLLALALTGTVEGRWMPGDVMALVLPSTGLVPAGVCAGLLVHALVRGRRR